MVHFHNCTISQSILPAACGYDACCKYTRQFFGFVNERTKLADLNIFGLPDYLEPNAGIRLAFSEKPLVSGCGVSNVRFEGLGFTASYGRFLDFDGADGVVVENCRFSGV